MAIVLVLLFHYRLFAHPEWIDAIGSFGWTGVDLFFALSGYLIASQLFAIIEGSKSISLKDFYIKRFFRIIPPYLLIVIIYFLVPYFREKEALPQLWRFLSFTQNFGLDNKHFGTFSHAWSLCIEEQFYMFFPLIIIASFHFKIKKAVFFLLPLGFVAGFVCRYYSWINFIVPAIDTPDFHLKFYQYIYYPTYNRLDALLMGVGIAGLFQFKPAVRQKMAIYSNLILLLGIVILTVAYFICIETFDFKAAVFGFPIVDIGYGLVVMAAICPTCILYTYSSKVTSWVATLSYAVYLSHKGIIHITQDVMAKAGVEVQGSLMFMLCMITVFAAAFMLHLIIEKPFLKLRNKVLKTHILAQQYSTINQV